MDSTFKRDLLPHYFQNQVAQIVAKQKKTKNLRFQDGITKEEMIYAPGGSHGGL